MEKCRLHFVEIIWKIHPPKKGRSSVEDLYTLIVCFFVNSWEIYEPRCRLTICCWKGAIRIVFFWKWKQIATCWWCHRSKPIILTRSTDKCRKLSILLCPLTHTQSILCMWMGASLACSRDFLIKRILKRHAVLTCVSLSMKAYYWWQYFQQHWDHLQCKFLSITAVDSVALQSASESLLSCWRSLSSADFPYGFDDYSDDVGDYD